jgi:rfaE bifunctional protein nucleotidyltransferase chain/domain
MNKALLSNTFTNNKFFIAEQCRYNIDTTKTIGLCHGVFDIIHVGHIEHLKEAKDKCDILIVSLTSDRYVNKGPDRPFFNLEHRLNVISALEYVDVVTISDSPSSEHVINCIKPDYYIKGIEYKEKEDITNKIDIERQAVEENGGQVLFLTNKNIFSSSKLLNDSLFGKEFLEFTKEIKKEYTVEDIFNIIDRLSMEHINLVGEIIIDEYIYGSCLGKSSKYPSIVFNKNKSESFLGGVGAVANQLSPLVKKINLVTYIGDKNFQESLEFITANLCDNISLDYIIKENSPTIKKTRFIDSYWKSRVFETYEINDRRLDEKESIIKNEKMEFFHDPLIIDYGHGFLCGTEKAFAVNVQSNSGNRGYNFITKYNNAELYIIDEQELRLEMRDQHSSSFDLAKKLQTKLKETLVVTIGSSGSIVISNDWQGIAPAISGEVKDAVGAGDAFFGIFSLLFKQGTPSIVAVFLANIAGYMEANVIGHKHEYSKLEFKQAVATLLK